MRDTDSRQIVVRIPPDVFRAAERKARREDRTLSQIVRLALNQYLSAELKKEKKP